MALPPPQPEYIFRGHAAQVHTVSFIRGNSRLMTGDANGWVVSWNTAIRRPVAVWKAHENGPILRVSDWGNNRVITHGKDNKLIVWKLSEADEASLSIVLPVDTLPDPRKQPWILQILEVNTMNFCSFAKCPVLVQSEAGNENPEELLIAVPNTISSETVDIFHLPSSKRSYTVANPPNFQGGMVMAVSLFHHPSSRTLTLISGYESGHTVVSSLNPNMDTWHALYLSKSHTQPILSLDVSPDKAFYLTSSADANIAKHTIPHSSSDPSIETVGPREQSPSKLLKTGHSGQQSLRIRNDSKVFATAGWDGRVRVYGLKNMKELAVLKWHKEGCYAVAFAEVEQGEEKGQPNENENEHGLVKRSGKMMVREERESRAQRGHWLAVGSKDAKVSLWDIY